MIKEIYRYEDVKDRILSGVDKITDPIRQTISPKGSNVILQTDNGNEFSTNDGVTIAKHIILEDPVESAIVEIMKMAALRTNTEGGDGTSTTILLSSILIKEGLKLVDNGENPMEVKKAFEDAGRQLKGELKKEVIKIENDEDLVNIAKVSSSNNEEISSNILKVVKTAGEKGQVMIVPSYSSKTEVIEDPGFIIKGGMFSEEFTLAANSMSAVYEDVPVLVTDKRLYYSQEAETILDTCLQNGYTSVVIVARDFIGEALPFFVTNHKDRKINVLLVKDPLVTETRNVTLDDLAIYLDGKFISEKFGSIVDNLQMADFCMAKKIFSDSNKTVIVREKEKKNKRLDDRVKMLKAEQKGIGNKDDSDYRKLDERISSLTNGMVTIKVGGDSPLEVKEKIFRYEDAVNATRTAMRDGYLIGGGLSIWKAFKNAKIKGLAEKAFHKVATANIDQIAINCGLHPDSVRDTITELSSKHGEYVGYNAVTEIFGDLKAEGVYDPYKVTELSIDNSVSIANVIISSKYLILNKIEDKDGK